MTRDPVGVELADLRDHYRALAAWADTQEDADRWHRIADLWGRDAAAARAALAEWEAELAARADPETTDYLARLFAAENRRRKGKK